MNVDIDEAPIELPYDDAAAEAAGPSLATRIKGPKVYLLEESAAALHARLGKRKALDDADEDMDEMDEDVSHRPNALLITGAPIANLPTKAIFSYAAYYDVVPLGLEWVDDRTCVLVFKTRAAARSALQTLSRSQPDESGLQDARPLPTSLWPIEERIASVLGHARAGTIHIRWAETGDVKKSGARQASEFYKKHGETAGKEIYKDGVLMLPVIPPSRDRDREREHDGHGRDDERARLDAELDAFIAGDGDNAAPRRPTERAWDRGKPPRRRSSRSASPRRRNREGAGRDGGRSGRRRSDRDDRTHNGRPHKSQAELDAELDAFLAER